jgi:hypothetical protein
MRHTPGTTHKTAAASETHLLPLLLLRLLRVLCFAVGVDRQGLAAFLVNEAHARHHA